MAIAAYIPGRITPCTIAATTITFSVAAISAVYTGLMTCINTPGCTTALSFGNKMIDGAASTGKMFSRCLEDYAFGSELQKKLSAEYPEIFTPKALESPEGIARSLSDALRHGQTHESLVNAYDEVFNRTTMLSYDLNNILITKKIQPFSPLALSSRNVQQNLQGLTQFLSNSHYCVSERHACKDEKSDLQKTMDSIQLSCTQERRELQEKMDTAAKKHGETEDALRREVKAEKEGLATKCDNEKETLQTKWEKEKAELETKHETFQTKWEKEKAELEQKFEQEKSARQEAEKQALKFQGMANELFARLRACNRDQGVFCGGDPGGTMDLKNFNFPNGARV